MAWPNLFQRGTLLSQFSQHHVVVFLLTFFSYSLLHASRKTFSNVKVSISEQWTPSAFNTSAGLAVEIWSCNHLFPSVEEATLFLGTLDTIFLFSYAVGLFISGIIGDRLNLRWVLSFGMCSSALVVFVFGTVTEWLHFYNKWLYCCLWIVNGLLQSTGWPCVVAVMGNWFGKAGRGVVFGLWSACASVGNILGACLASSVLQYGYEYAFLVTASVQFAGGIVIFFGLLVSPEEIGLSGIEAEENSEEDSHRPLINGAENEDEYEPNYSVQEDNAVTQVKAISFYQACCLPGVMLYSLAYACLKLVNYSFFFWLPFYLSNNFRWKEAEADKLSIWYDVGGIIVFSVFDPGQARMDVGFLLFHSHDKLYNCVYLTINSEGSIVSCAKETSSRIEWVTGAHKKKRTIGDIAGLLCFLIHPLRWRSSKSSSRTSGYQASLNTASHWRC
ncbi:PREDICTED: sugar phosphate exchanger 3 isoform X2 [Galeopterus variegatus]|uniref:Sugar phosphate exchanger 3 isoform X2 n=1 Tax=Galeopterus variegatus TaxID=482537 RepID=A0ABM0RQT5_GALVR|nr:PREDICTED: sugar phosphate exchanger 3 isoform X2 [Galeopterus variegatus]